MSGPAADVVARVLAWAGDALRVTTPFAGVEAAVERSRPLLDALPRDDDPASLALRAVVHDVRSKLVANLRTDDADEPPAREAVRAGELYEAAGLWHLSAASYVQAAVVCIRAGEVSACLDLVVRGLLGWQAGTTARGEPPALGAVVPGLAALDGWAARLPAQARIDNQLGIVAYELHAYDQAVRLYREGIDAGVDPATPGGQVASLLHNLAESLLARGALPDEQLGRADRERLFTEALRAARAVAEGRHGDAWEGVDGPRLVADALCRLGRPAQAWEVLARVEARYGRHPGIGQAPVLRLVRGRCLRALGRPVEATVELDAAVTELDKAASDVEGDLARLERSLAFEDAGDLEAAWRDAAAVASGLWVRHRAQVRGLYDLVWTRAGFEGERRHLEALAETLTRVASTDPLTGLLNRRGLDEALAGVDPLADLGVLVVDVDYFKTVNDRFGHDVGDDVLCRIAACLAAEVGDAGRAVARWGGEEFVVVVHPPPGRLVDPAVSRDAVAALGERLRSVVAALRHGPDGPARTTVSVGAAVGRARWWREVLDTADEAMFRAKRGGRDRVVGA